MQAGPDGKLERFLTGLQRGAKTTLFALHLTEGVAGAYGEVSVGSTRPRVADQIGERVLGFADSALHQRRYRQIPAGEVPQGPVTLARVSKGLLGERDRAFGVAALTGKLGPQLRDRPGNVSQPAGRLLDRRLVRLVSGGER